MIKFTKYKELKHGDIVNVYNSRKKLVYENARLSFEGSGVYVVHNNENAKGSKPKFKENLFGYHYGYWVGIADEKGFSRLNYVFKFELLENNKYREK